jgi:hypothetical protein
MRILAMHRALFGRREVGGRGARTMSETDIAQVVEIFEAMQIRWGLVGTYAVGLLTEPRATVDFDFVVDDRKLGSVIDELTVVFGRLDESDLGAAVQLRAIDVKLIRSTNHPLFRVALDEQRTIGEWHVPRAEVIVVLKFLAAVSPWRDQHKRRQDIVDISSSAGRPVPRWIARGCSSYRGWSTQAPRSSSLPCWTSSSRAHRSRSRRLPPVQWPQDLSSARAAIS